MKTIITFIGLLVILCCGGILVKFHFYHYVSSKYSIYCYNYGEEGSRIQRKQYFNTLAECNKPLKSI